jgi:predicted RNA-binding Zn-ribbon protein involved in translation (DUF1610 family)
MPASTGRIPGHRTRYREAMADDLLFVYLRDNDADCAVCGYGLRGLTTRVCPECGVEIALGVRATDARLRLWITGLVSLSLPTGFFVIFLVFLGIGLLAGQPGPPMNQFWPMVVGAVLGALAIALLLAYRRRFRAAPVPTRATLVAAIDLVMAGLVAYQMYLIF